MNSMSFVRITSFVVVLALGLPAQVLAAPKGDNGKGNGNGSGGGPAPSTATVMTAPYPDGRFNRDCDRTANALLFEQCDDYSGWSEDGYVNAFSRVSSPQFGKYPQVVANNSWSRAEVMGVTSIPSPVERLPILVTFRVETAEATLGGTRPVSHSPNSSAAGGFIIGLPGLPEMAHTVVDTSVATPEPDTFSGDVTITRELTNVPAGELRIWAGVGGSAGVGVGDAASAMLSIEATVVSIAVGSPTSDPSPSPTPSPSPSSTSAPVTTTTFTAPFDVWGTAQGVRLLGNYSSDDKGSVTQDGETGSVGFQMDAVGTKVWPGSSAGSAWFLVPYSIPRSATVTITAIWDIPQVASVHSTPSVYGPSSTAWADAALSVKGVDGSEYGVDLGDESYERVKFFDDFNGQTLVRDGEVSVTVTIPEVEGDILIYVGVAGDVRTSLGLSHLDASMKLRNVTVRY